MKIVVYVISFLTLVFFALSWHSKISSRNYESDSANVDGAGPTIVNDWDSTNLSSWKRENVSKVVTLTELLPFLFLSTHPILFLPGQRSV